MKARNGSMSTGAATRPEKAVKTTSVITRGFIRSKKSRGEAVETAPPSACVTPVWVSVSNMPPI
jgi:uncharacterized protein (DUF2237 family)